MSQQPEAGTGAEAEVAEPEARSRSPSSARARQRRSASGATSGSRACPSRLRCRRPPRPDSGAYIAVIRVVGVGGAGLNALNRMIDAGIHQVEFVAVNTDIQALQVADAPTKIHIGRDITEGLGSGADPTSGGARPRRPATRSGERCAAPTWCS